MPDWLLITAIGMPGVPEPLQSGSPLRASARPGPGSPLYGHVLDDGAVAIDQHRRRPPVPEASPGSIAAAGPAAQCQVAASGMADAGGQHLEHLGAVAGAGRIRRQLKSAVRIAHPAPATAAVRRRRSSSATGTVSANAAGQQVEGPSAQRRLGPAPPVPAVQPVHQHVVGVAALLAKARPPAGRAYRMSGPALALRQAVAGVQNPQRQVGVLAEGPREPLVEAADQAQDVASVRHVRGDPPRRLQAGRAPLPVGRAAVRRQRHGDPSLNAGHRRRLVQVRDQVGQPVLGDDDIVVEERHPVGRRSPASRRCAPPPDRGRRCASTVTPASRGESGRSRSRRGRRPVVDDDDRGAGRSR